MRTHWIVSARKPKRALVLQLLIGAAAAWFGCGFAVAADETFHIELVSELNPFPPIPPSTFSWADVWAENDYAYVGSDRSNRGVSIFELIEDNDGKVHPTYITTYAGTEMEDVEVHNGIGYFGSDVSLTSGQSQGTGVDIVNLMDPTQPVYMNRINQADGGHYKVHTLSYDGGFLYTSDNATDVVKIFNVADPFNPVKLPDLDMGLGSGFDSHEVVARNGRLYVASKEPGNNTTGWTHIFDIANVGTTGPVLLKAINTGGATHTSHASDDNKTLVISQERTNGQVRIYDISMIDQPSDPDAPVLLKTLTKPAADAHSPHHIMYHDELMFLTWYEAGLQVYNMTDPANPLLVGSFDTYPGTSTNFNGNWGVFPDLAFDRVLLSDRSRGLIVVDASDVVPTPDFDKNFAAEGIDFLAWQRGFGKTSNATLAEGDGNRNRIVDGLDLALWRKSFGDTEISHDVSAVPEGSTTAMLLISAAALLRCRRTRPQL